MIIYPTHYGKSIFTTATTALACIPATPLTKLFQDTDTSNSFWNQNNDQAKSMRNKYIDFSSYSSLLFIRDRLFVKLDHEIRTTIIPIIQRDTKKKRGENRTMSMMQRVSDMKIKEAQCESL